jgi:hypothetical protein
VRGHAAAVLAAALQQPLWHEQACTDALACIADACTAAFSLLCKPEYTSLTVMARVPVPPQVAASGLLPVLEAAVRQLAVHVTAAAGDDGQAAAAAAAVGSSSSSSITSRHAGTGTSDEAGCPDSSSSSSREEASQASTAAPAVCQQGLIASPVVAALCKVVIMVIRLWPGERPGSTAWLLYEDSSCCVHLTQQQESR